MAPSARQAKKCKKIKLACDNRKIKSVSFRYGNDTDILAYADSIDFSVFVKKALRSAMNRANKKAAK